MQFVQLTKPIQDQIISLWILGHSREYIENLFHISHGTIHNIVSQYTQADPLVPLLRQIGVAIKSAGLKVDEYAINLRIIQAVARLGCSTHWIETFLARIENEYLSTNRPIEELVTTIAEISEFLAMRNLSVQKALNFLKELMEKIMRLESETNLAEEKRLQSNKLLQDTLSKNQVSMEKVDAFVSHEARLKEMGLTTTDYSKMYNVLVKFKESGFDMEKIVPLIESVLSLKDQKVRLGRDCLQMSTTIRQQTEYKQSAIDFWRDKYDAFVKDYIWLKGTYDVTKEEFASIVFALRNSYPYISPAELVELIQMYGNMKSGITGMLGTYPIS